MGEEISMVRARFALRFRCANCRLIMCRELVSPDLEDAPADAEELLGSALLAGQYYPCQDCDNPVSTLIGIRQLETGESVEDPEPPAVVATTKRRPGAGPMTALQRAMLLSTSRRRGLG